MVARENPLLGEEDATEALDALVRIKDLAEDAIDDALDSMNEAAARAANERVMGVEAKARYAFERTRAAGDAIEEAIASMTVGNPDERGIRAQINVLYRGDRPSLFTLTEHGGILTVLFENRDVCVDFVRDLMATEASR